MGRETNTQGDKHQNPNARVEAQRFLSRELLAKAGIVLAHDLCQIDDRRLSGAGSQRLKASE